MNIHEVIQSNNNISFGKLLAIHWELLHDVLLAITKNIMMLDDHRKSYSRYRIRVNLVLRQPILKVDPTNLIGPMTRARQKLTVNIRKTELTAKGPTLPSFLHKVVKFANIKLHLPK